MKSNDPAPVKPGSSGSKLLEVPQTVGIEDSLFKSWHRLGVLQHPGNDQVIGQGAHISMHLPSLQVNACDFRLNKLDAFLPERA